MGWKPSEVEGATRPHGWESSERILWRFSPPAQNGLVDLCDPLTLRSSRMGKGVTICEGLTGVTNVYLLALPSSSTASPADSLRGAWKWKGPFIPWDKIRLSKGGSWDGLQKERTVSCFRPRDCWGQPHPEAGTGRNSSYLKNILNWGEKSYPPAFFSLLGA